MSSRRLLAIMFTDIVGYTASMGRDEKHALSLLDKNREIQRPIIEQFHGLWIKELGDGVMASFPSVSDAVNAAINIQEACLVAGEFQLRIGINQGEVIFDGKDVFGDAVNIASRIQGNALPGTIYISESVQANLANKKEIRTRFITQVNLKNVQTPVKIYEVLPAKATPAEKPIPQNETKLIYNSIAVLPFANLSSDPEQEYFSDGITEEIITDLSGLHTLSVISRSSVMTFKGSPKKLKEIAAELNVQYILEGSVRKAGINIRITAQLIDALHDTHIWAEKYSGTLEDVFEIQEQVSKAIVQALKIKLTPAEKNQIANRPIRNIMAYDTWIQAMYEARKFSGPGIERGILLARRALELEGENALLYSTLGYLYWAAYDFGIYYNKETLELIGEYAEKALLLDPLSPQALFTKGLLSYKKGEMKGFLQNAKQAVDLGAESDSQCLYAFVLAETGFTDQALLYAEKALTSDPLVFLPWWSRAAINLLEGKTGLAYSRILEARNRLAPGEPFAGWWVAQMAAYAGEEEVALEEFRKVVSSNGGIWSEFSLLFQKALEKDKEGVYLHLQSGQIRDYAMTDEYYPVFFANALALVEEYEESIKCLNQAVHWGFSNYRFLLNVNRFLFPLQEHPKFKELIDEAKKQQESFLM